MASNCQIPTPEQYVEKLLDNVGYIAHLYNKTFLENSCGEGNILKVAVRRYIESALSDGYTKDEIKEGLESHFVGYDIDQKCVIKCTHALNLVAEVFGIIEVKWNITQRDYLRCEPHEYDYVVGNPPYITYHDLTDDQRSFLKKRFLSCNKGRFDYCYAFIEAGMRDLSSIGRLAYIIPYSILRNKFASTTRNIIKPKLKKLIDYKGIEIFPSILTSSIAIICDAQNSEMFEYVNMSSGWTKEVFKEEIKEDWIFETKNEGAKRFGDYFKVSNSIATLLNDAFIFNIDGQDNDYYYVNEYKIESMLVYNAISAKSGKMTKGQTAQKKA
ncbi:MAG: hypothetical protein LUF92_14005 [Clostridiales bacterium]|nr:hypothetical protein [Clostridiales bacterium]